jgi:glutamate-1-semialdehyde 2,1-aminomutase
MTAGLKTLELISRTDFYSKLTAKTEALVGGLKMRAAAAGVPATTNQVGGMFGLFFSDAEKVSDFSQSMACDQDRFRKFFHAMLDRGVYLAPSAFEAGFVSAAHSDEDLQQTLDAAEESFAEVA